MTVKEYIRNTSRFELMPFVTVYSTIMQLINDGYVEKDAFKKEEGGPDVEDVQPESPWKGSRGLHC